MKSTETLQAFREILKRERKPLSLRRALRDFVSFYSDMRVDDCDTDDDGDMLLFQWGTYDWGNGERYEYSLTRQFIIGPGEDEDIWQLQLTFRYPVNDALRKLGTANSWCRRPHEVDGCRASIEAAMSFQAVADRDDATAELTFECAG